MTTHVQAKALRNLVWKISKYGSNTGKYNVLRQAFLETSNVHKHFVPDFVVNCETPTAVRAYLNELTFSNEKGTVYKRRRRFLEREFAELIYWSEREVLLPPEIDAFEIICSGHTAAMDPVIQLIRGCVETDPRRSIVMSRHAVLDTASYLLESNGMSADVTAGVQEHFELIIQMAEHPIADQNILLKLDRHFLSSVMPLVTYIERQNSYFSWEEGNRSPDYPSVQIARHFCQAAVLLCETFGQWSSDDGSSG